MSEKPSKSHVVDNPDESRYEIYADDELAGFAVYIEQDGQIVFVHTEIAGKFGGKGLGTVLAKHAIEDANARELTIVPVCPFIADWLRKHPEYQQHVDWDAAKAIIAGAKPEQE